MSGLPNLFKCKIFEDVRDRLYTHEVNRKTGFLPNYLKKVCEKSSYCTIRSEISYWNSCTQSHVNLILQQMVAVRVHKIHKDAKRYILNEIARFKKDSKVLLWNTSCLRACRYST